MPTKSVRYIVRGILPRGEVSILSGASGAGKSTIIAQLLAAIQAGEDTFFGHRINHPIRVGYIAADRTWESYEELAARARLDLSHIQIRSLVDDTSIDVDRLERDSMRLLYDLISSFDSPDLIVVDPMVVFLGVDPNKYNAVAPRLIKMGRWCKQDGFTILATHHATKARTDYSFKRPQDRISGSSALLGFTSSQLFLSAPDEIGKPYAEFTAVNHNDPPENIRLERGENGLFVPYNEKQVNATLVSLVEQAIETGGNVSRTWVQTNTAIETVTLDNALDYLVACNRVKVNAKGEFRLNIRAEKPAN